jgi:hypothetical protein
MIWLICMMNDFINNKSNGFSNRILLESKFIKLESFYSEFKKSFMNKKIKNHKLSMTEYMQEFFQSFSLKWFYGKIKYAFNCPYSLPKKKNISFNPEIKLGSDLNRVIDNSDSVLFGNHLKKLSNDIRSYPT